MSRGSARSWLLMIVAVLLPLGCIALVLYGAGRLAFGKRRVATIDPYDEWLKLRDLLHARRAETDVHRLGP